MIYPNEKTNSLDSKAVLKRFLEIFLTLTLLIIVAALVVFQTETNSAQAIIAENESQTLDLQAQVIGSNFKNIISDVRFLARLSDAQSLANDPNDDTARWKLNQDLFIFARQMQVYNRIQFFDSAGTELVRANYIDSAPALWPDDASQSKSNRADLDATLSLNQNEIYISPFELNSDQPPKPVIRFGTPVFDRAGVKRGVLLVNYVGVVLLDNLKYTSTQSAGTVMMLNADGYFLIGPTPADEWGFMYPDPRSHTFSAIYPGEDPQISREAGQFTDSAGLFTFKTVYPLADGLQTMVAREKSPDLPAAQKGSRDYHWKIVSRVPPEVLAMRGRQVTQTLIPLALAALVILGYGSYLLARAIVRRQHVEEALHEQFGFLEKLLDTIPNPVWFKDLTGIYRGCNKAYEDFYGLTRTRLIGKTAEDIHPKEIAARYRELDEALLRSPGIQQQEATARRADGIVREVVLSKATYTTTEGKLAGIVGVILDITERKQMEVQVAQLKQFNESIVQGMTEGIVMDDADGKIVFVNPATAAMLGYAENELIGQHWSAVASPDQQEIVRNSNKKRALGEKSQYEIEITRKDGTRVTTLVSGKPRYENGQYVGTLAVFTDITERKTAEERLRQFSRAVEQSPASIVITDTDGNIQYVNPKFLRVTGYTFEEALGKNPRVLKSGETPSEEYKKLWDTITAGGEWHGEFHNKKKNGEMYWESASISAITDDKGKVTRFLAVKEDITARKEMERKLAEERNQLDTILNNLPAMVFIKDREGRYIFSNREHIRLLGGTQLSDVVGKTSDAFFPSDLSANVRNDDKQVFEFGTAINNQEETSIDPQTGQLLVRLTTKVPLRDVAGNIVGLLGIARDITERKRAEEVLRESEERFRAVAESAHDAIVTTDSSGVVVGWNRGAQEMFGYDTNEIV
ncbi:partial Nitrogen fixation regulatory protein, partial [Anaerolineae bacterium]